MSKEKEKKIESELIDKSINLLIEKLETFREKSIDKDLKDIVKDFMKTDLASLLTKVYESDIAKYIIPSLKDQDLADCKYDHPLVAELNKARQNKNGPNEILKKDTSSNNEDFFNANIRVVQKTAEKYNKEYQIIKNMIRSDIFEVLFIQYSEKMVKAINESKFFETNHFWKDMPKALFTKSFLEAVFSNQIDTVQLITLRANIKRFLFFDMMHNFKSLSKSIQYEYYILDEVGRKEMKEELESFNEQLSKGMKSLFNFFIREGVIEKNPFGKKSPYLQISNNAYGNQMQEIISYMFEQSKEQLDNSFYKDLYNSYFLVNVEDIFYPDIKLRSDEYDEFFNTGTIDTEYDHWYSLEMREKFPHFSRMFEFYMRDEMDIRGKDNPLALQIIRSYLVFLVCNDISNIFANKEFYNLSDIKKELRILSESIYKFFNFYTLKLKDRVFQKEEGEAVKKLDSHIATHIYNDLEKQIDTIESKKLSLINFKM